MMLISKFKKLFFLALASLYFIAGGPASLADENAMLLLEKTGTAAKTLNYDGIFTYQAEGKTQSIQIIHRADEKGEVERLLSLDGAMRELVRTEDKVTVIFPEGQEIYIDKNPLGRGFPSDLSTQMNSAKPYYNLVISGEKRIADRKASEMAVVPIDGYRYGYRLWIDKQSGLLLKSELVNEKGEILEHFCFVSIRFNIDIPDIALQPQNRGQQRKWKRNKIDKKREKITLKHHQNWRVAWLPSGFELVAQQSRHRSPNDIVTQQRVYSDGLSSVSVFLETKTGEKHLKGISKMGAIHAYGLMKRNYYITVFGQVPAQTVERIGRNIEFIH